MASAEYLTMVRCTSILTTAFESDPITIANDLHAKGFISPSVKNEVVDTIQANSYKASKLVGCVTSQISISSDSRVKGKFKAFVQVLEGHTWLADTVEDVIHKYEGIICCNFDFEPCTVHITIISTSICLAQMYNTVNVCTPACSW